MPMQHTLGDYQTKQTLETFGFLPPMTQDEIYDQIAYIFAQGWTPAIEHVHPSQSMKDYWTMWKLPFFGEQDLDRVGAELEACHRAYPDHHPATGPCTRRRNQAPSAAKAESHAREAMMNTNANHQPSGREAALARRRAQSTRGKQGNAGSTIERTRGADFEAAPRPAAARPTSAPKAAATAPVPPKTRESPPPARAATAATAARSAPSAGGPSRDPSHQSRARAMARRAALSRAGGRAAGSTDRVRATTAETSRRTASQAGAGPNAGRETTAPRVPAAPLVAARTAPQAAPALTTERARGGSSPPRATSPASPSHQSRASAKARREALSRSGRRAAKSVDRVRAEAAAVGATKDCGCGCQGTAAEGKCREGREGEDGAPSVRPRNGKARVRANGEGAVRARRVKGSTAQPLGRLVALARRSALSTRGKAAADTPTSAAGLARQADPGLSGRELAQRVRERRSRNGSAGLRKTQSSGRMRAERRQGAADQSWKVGVSETAAGQTVTGTRVGRSTKTTGDEPSTCRTITGTEYLGAEIFHEFCQTPPAHGPDKVRTSLTGHGNRVTGSEVGRSTRVTGDEPGTCKAVTGTEYLSWEQQDAFCGFHAEPGPRKVGLAATRAGQAVSGTRVGRSVKVTGDEQGADVRPTGTQYTDAQSIRNGRVDGARGRVEDPMRAEASAAPAKVGTSLTLAGSRVTGTRVGRSLKVTGDEPGGCRVVTGDEYVDRGQYEDFCSAIPPPAPPKVGRSTTAKRLPISGTQTGRSPKVTGDEPGTCKAVTGTPYAGLEQASDYCEGEAQRTIEARTRRLAMPGPGPRATGTQPGFGGPLTGAAKGACEPVTGTPYFGRDQYAEACEGMGAEPGDGDFPRPLDGGPAPWERFSVMPPSRRAFTAPKEGQGVTGTRYETGTQITGPFDMGVGKITGTEQFRFDAKRLAATDLGVMEAAAGPTEQPPQPPAAEGPSRPRITGEGQSAGARITGDDWDRGDRVTGTEGASARRRNPTRPGPMSALPPLERKRNEEVPPPVSRVTGSSGNTARGALVTYSGGARG